MYVFSNEIRAADWVKANIEITKYESQTCIFAQSEQIIPLGYQLTANSQLLGILACLCKTALLLLQYDLTHTRIS